MFSHTLQANRRWRGQEKELGLSLSSTHSPEAEQQVFPNLEAILEMASSTLDAGTKQEKPMNEFYAHYGLPQSFYERCFAREFVKDGLLPDDQYVGSGTKPQPKLSSLYVYFRAFYAWKIEPQSYRHDVFFFFRSPEID